MRHSGKARRAAFKLILLTLIAGLVFWALLAVASLIGTILSALVIPIVGLGIWLLFAVFTLFFFRDPTPRVPAGANLLVSPAHGKIDVVDTITEPQFMGGECQRISMFLSVFNVHVQYAPIGGKVTFLRYTMGQFINALKTESAIHNESVLLGFDGSEPPGHKVGVRLIAGVIARRIVPFVQLGEEMARGERISLIQFGSRADVYLPKSARIQVKVGDAAVGGETVLAILKSGPSEGLEPQAPA